MTGFVFLLFVVWMRCPANGATGGWVMLGLNNKQNKHTNPIINRQDYHLTQPCPSEEKQTKKTQHKSHKPLHQPWGTEMKRKKEFSLGVLEKETSNTISLKTNNEKAEKHCINEGTN